MTRYLQTQGHSVKGPFTPSVLGIEQANAVFEHGVFLTEIINKDHKLLLYQIDSFYIEGWYDSKGNKIVQYRSFVGMEKLEPYLHKFNIDLSY